MLKNKTIEHFFKIWLKDTIMQTKSPKSQTRQKSFFPLQNKEKKIVFELIPVHSTYFQSFSLEKVI